jgi:hypothetical protein
VVTARAPKRRPSKLYGALRLLACICVGLLLAVPLYVGLAMSGVIRSPFLPRAEGDLALAKSDRPGLRVLFVGNSFTYYNEMPAMLHELAAHDDGGRPLFSVEYTAPNWTLRKAAANEGLEDLLHDVRWDVVVLQEQSQLLSLSEDWRRREVIPFVRALDRDIRVSGARTTFFLTWAYEQGDQRNWPGDSFEGMQARLLDGYSEAAGLLSADIVPVGLVWAQAHTDRPSLDLWKPDGHHPSRAGSYLTACVFYRELTGRDPLNSDYTGGLDREDAHFLQLVAGDVVDEYEATG